MSLRIAIVVALAWALPPVLVVAAGAKKAASIEWVDDLEQALAKAKADECDVLAFYNGSDWSTPARRFKSDVLQTPEFGQFAKGRFVCLEIDHRNDTSKQDPELRKRNGKLSAPVWNYPTLALVDREGRVYATISGTPEGGYKGLIGRLTELVKLRERRDEHFARAQSATGRAKAVQLGRGLEEIDPKLIGHHYRGILDQIKAADPEDQAGYYERFTFDSGSFAEKEIWPRCKDKQFDEALTLIDRRLKNDKLTVQQKQLLLAAKFQVYQRWEKMDQAFEMLGQIGKLDPKSDMARGAQGYLDYYNKPLTVNGTWGPWHLHTRPVEWRMDVTDAVSRPGTYEVEFTRTEGGDDVEVSSVVLTAGDKELATAEKVQPKLFRFQVDKLPSESPRLLKMQVKGVGWWLSAYGEIKVRAAQ
jgi:hypothetical protein